MGKITTYLQAFEMYLSRQSDIEAYLQSYPKNPEALVQATFTLAH
jgi:hypothetical protein